MLQFKGTTIHGSIVSAAWQSEAWVLCIASRDPTELERALVKTGPKFGRDDEAPGDWPHHWYISEIANRMRQRARKAGAIALDGSPRRWRFM